MAKGMQFTVRSFSDTEARVRELLSSKPETPVAYRGICYLRSGERVVSCKDTPEGRQMLEEFRFADTPRKGLHSEEEALCAVLEGAADPGVLKDFGFADHVPRCVVLFHPLQGKDSRQLRELIPTEGTDRTARTGNGDTALIIHTDYRTEEEVFEYAQAAVGTLETEAGIACSAGIGRQTETLAGIPVSYTEAASAIRTGTLRRMPGRVYAYGRQTLERIVDAIPPEKVAAIRREILRPGSEKVLTDEILETVKDFFRNDLNLSTTARQLFIHRNTLLYRMEKIHKETGLDLRKFEDAVVFRMLMDQPGERME